ncbi:MAG: nucleotidyltransferase family protein [Lentisphaeraceae bacterium]|nr:nucleotidyltransferase family protein [Lentisphaeraceae bacterium]
MHKITEAIILCGGLGTRLQTIIKDQPKPMANIGGKPFLSWIIERLIAQGIQHIILSTGFKSNIIEKALSLWENQVKISISKEDHALGTGGAIKLALPLLKTHTFLALNGDSFTPFSIKSLSELHFTQNSDTTLWLCQVEDASRYGTVSVNKQGRILNFLEKQEISQTASINAGIYILTKQVFQPFKDEIFSLEKDLFPTLIKKKFYGIETTTPFIDIGTPESYSKAHNFMNAQLISRSSYD